jgi:hypothetical protein
VCDASVSIPPSEAHHPFSKYGSVDEGIAPEHVTNTRMRVKKCPECFVFDESYFTRTEAPYVMVHPLKVKALKIGNVARNIKGQNLSLTARHDFVTEEEAFDDQTALGRSVVLSDDVLFLLELFEGHRESNYGRFLVLLDGCDALQLANERMIE